MNGPEVFNYTSVSEDVIRAARAELSKMQCQIIHIARKSDHPEDGYLYVVMGRKKAGNRAYIVWTLNTSRLSLNNGHYELTYPMAIKIFADAVYSAYA